MAFLVVFLAAFLGAAFLVLAAFLAGAFLATFLGARLAGAFLAAAARARAIKEKVKVRQCVKEVRANAQRNRRLIPKCPPSIQQFEKKVPLCKR